MCGRRPEYNQKSSPVRSLPSSSASLLIHESQDGGVLQAPTYPRPSSAPPPPSQKNSRTIPFPQALNCSIVPRYGVLFESRQISLQGRRGTRAETRSMIYMLNADKIESWSIEDRERNSTKHCNIGTIKPIERATGISNHPLTLGS